MPASEICSSQCIIAVGNMFWFCVPGGWQKDVLLLEVFPPRNWDSALLGHTGNGMPESGQRKQLKISSFNTFFPQKWVHTARCRVSCGCGQEHLAIFAKSGLLGSNRGKELVHHAMVSLGPLQPQPPLFFPPPCDINLQKQKEAADR